MKIEQIPDDCDLFGHDWIEQIRLRKDSTAAESVTFCRQCLIRREQGDECAEAACLC